MILPINSYLRYPHKHQDPKQVMTFNAMRYCFDMCEISANRLLKNLELISEKGEIHRLEMPAIFLDTWSIINNSIIFKNILFKNANLSDGEPFLIEISKAINLRHSNQHLDERIQQLQVNELPIYGTLSWTKLYPPTNKAKQTIIYSGTFTNVTKAGGSLKITSEDEISDVIQNIEFRSIIKTKNAKKSVFTTSSVLINKIIHELKWWANHLHEQLEEQIGEFDINLTHKSDLLLQMYGVNVSAEQLETLKKRGIIDIKDMNQ